MDVTIVTDSTSDIPHDLARQYGIQIVANTLVIDGQSVLDDEGFSRPDFYNRLPGMRALPTTATASAGTYEQLYEEILSQGSRAICSIHAASLLSGIYNAASLAAQAFGERVRVVDSQQVSLGLGFQVLAAAETARQGQGLQAILARLEDVRRRIQLFAMIDSLEYIRRSGRVSWARASLGDLLRIKLFIEVKEGVVRRLGEVRTRSKGLMRLAELLAERGPFERLAIIHSNAEAEARAFLAGLNLSLPMEPLLVNITTVIGAHIGPNALGVAGVVAK